MSLILTRVGTIPVAVTAIGNCHAVQVRPLPLPGAFLVYDSSGALQGPIANDTYTFRAPSDASFTPGEVVGYVGVTNGTMSFEIEDQHGTAFDR